MARRATADAGAELPVFTKSQLIAAERWSSRERDMLEALLTDDGTYTVQQASVIMDEFQNQEAK